MWMCLKAGKHIDNLLEFEMYFAYMYSYIQTNGCHRSAWESGFWRSWFFRGHPFSTYAQISGFRTHPQTLCAQIMTSLWQHHIGIRKALKTPTPLAPLVRMYQMNGPLVEPLIWGLLLLLAAQLRVAASTQQPAYYGFHPKLQSYLTIDQWVRGISSTHSDIMWVLCVIVSDKKQYYFNNSGS